MRDDFAVFILSHGRAGNVITYDTLQRCGYSGKLFIVVDNEDKQQDLYKAEYGEEAVIVFDKQEYFEKVDTISIGGERKTPLFVRNAIVDIAEEMGFKYFAMWDDDIENLQHRFERDGKLSGKVVSRLDDVFSAMVEFMEQANIDVMAFTNAGGLIGGLHGRFSEGLRRQRANTYILKTGKKYPFIGTYNEDMNLSLLLAGAGRLIFELTGISFYAPERGSNAGGLSDTYSQKNWHYINFHSVVCCPWACKTKGDKLVVRWEKAIPKIISQRWKK